MPRTTEDIFDEWLVARYLAGGRNADDALRTLVLRWDRRLHLHARRLLQDGEAAGEIVQDAWIAIVRGLPRIDRQVRGCGATRDRGARSASSSGPLDRELSRMCVSA
jgi:hypothetical protein